MKISRISRAKGHRIFKDFQWPVELPDFARFNLIYGWNGSGKTTLSNLLRHIELREPISEGEVEFHIDGDPLQGASLGTETTLPRVRVFNRDFVAANVFGGLGQILLPQKSIFEIVDKLKPIFFLGKDSIEKQKEVEELIRRKAATQQILAEKLEAKSKTSKALDDFCIREAKALKELLSSSGTNPYNTYDKSDFKKTSIKLANLPSLPAPLSDESKRQLKRRKDATPKEPIEEILVPLAKLEEIHQSVETILQRTVVSQVLQQLASDAALSDWVREGLIHHTGEKHAKECHFCGSPISAGRIDGLRAHFNNEYNLFMEDLDGHEQTLNETKEGLTTLQLPDKAKFQDHLVHDFQQAVISLGDYVEEAANYLSTIGSALAEKRKFPFKSLMLARYIENVKNPDINQATIAIKSINDVIALHNTESKNVQNVVAEARRQLEEGLVMEALVEFRAKTESIKQLDSEITNLQSQTDEATTKISILELAILEQRQPAEELNAELCSYLGRDELKFDFLENGYQIKRHGIAAKNLSEGERTAIAFLYFLKSLQAKDFSIGEDIVVIDDPVSSLDANALFSAFGYMKARTKDVGQLFILTHNFGFFRQVKNWFSHLNKRKSKDPKKRPANFYMIATETAAGKRCAGLNLLDPLLHQFESEYHYLFKKVHHEAQKGVAAGSLEAYYGMPNISRRLLESFLSFRYPSDCGELKQQLDKVNFDSAKKSRILRFLHTYSHDGKISEPEHDLSILSETPEVLKDLLHLLEAEDPRHFAEMTQLIVQ